MQYACYPDLDQLFNDACKRLLASSWLEFNTATEWYVLLPTPPYEYPSEYIMYSALGGKSQINRIEAEARERSAYWQIKAQDWFAAVKRRVERRKQEAEDYISQCVDVVNSHYGPLLNKEKTFYGWMRLQKDLSLESFTDLQITFDNISEYVSPIVQKRKDQLIGDGVKVVFDSVPKEYTYQDTVDRTECKLKNKRGPYKKSQFNKDQAIKYYESEVRDSIAKRLKKRERLDRNEIEKPIILRLIEKGYNERTLRGYLPETKRSELFGEIHRQVLELLPFNIK